jgi:hypothetical protein
MSMRVLCSIVLFAIGACSASTDIHAISIQEVEDRETNLPSGGTGCSIDEETGVCRCLSSPIIVDLAGDGIHLTGPENGVLFSLRDRPWLWSWTAGGSDDAWLVLDRNNNGRIDNGSEMFGDSTLQATSQTPNGFSALSLYDGSDNGGNGDGVIDDRDEVWPRLRLWRDVDHDGVSQPHELIALDKARVYSMSTTGIPESVKNVDSHGNEFRFSGAVSADSPVSSKAYDVWLVGVSKTFMSSGGGGSTNSTDYYLYTCKAWMYAVDTASPPYDQPQIACSIPSVIGFPVVNLQPDFPELGLFATDVRASAIGVSRNDTMLQAKQIVLDSAYPVGVSATCRQVPYPSGDPEGTYPFDDINPNTKCTFVHIVTEDPPPSSGGC